MATMDRSLVQLIEAQGQEKFVSIEFFPPKTDAGVQTLFKHLETLKKVNPLFADVTWGAGGSTSDLTLSLCEGIKDRGMVSNMHLTCTNMEKSKIDTALEGCAKAGIVNILALRGDPPAGQTVWTAKDAELTCALDLIKYIKASPVAQSTDFNITVAGYPEGHPTAMKPVPEGVESLTESEKTRYSISTDADTGKQTVMCCRDDDYKTEISYLKSKIDAGATAIVTQMFFDAEVFGIFVKDCRQAGINVPILPGIMCISNMGGFKRMTDFCKSRIPDAVMSALEKANEVIGDGEDAVKEAAQRVKETGVQIIVDMCSRLLEMGTPGLHFYTLNQSAATIEIVEKLQSMGMLA